MPSLKLSFSIRRELFKMQECDSYLFWRYICTYTDGQQYVIAYGASSVMSLIGE